jgi:UDP-N-acetylglucosamine 4-epimerase
MQQKLINSTVLITGGAGFIGSNLCEVLLAQANQVICLDNLSTGKFENIKPFLQNPNFSFIEGDIRNLATCKAVFQKNIDYVFHQAALGSVNRSIKDPLTTHEVNTTGFLNVLTAAKDAKVKRFVYAASSSTYGDHKSLPKYEDVIGKPLSPYAVTKYVNELYANVFADLYGIECIGLRYFNVFGQRQQPDGEYAAVIPKFVSSLIQQKSPIIHGDGEQTRDFTYIDNVVQANQLAALATNPQAMNTVYNIAFGENTSLNQLYNQIQSLLNQFNPNIAHIKPIYSEPRIGDIRNSLASIEKANTLLGYQPTHNLQKGLSESIQWYWDFEKKRT